MKLLWLLKGRSSFLADLKSNFSFSKSLLTKICYVFALKLLFVLCYRNLNSFIKQASPFFYLLKDVIITELLFSKIFEGSILLIL